jgi:hypothetical protein
MNGTHMKGAIKVHNPRAAIKTLASMVRMVISSEEYGFDDFMSDESPFTRF